MLYQEKPRGRAVACHRKDDDKKGIRGRFGDKCETPRVEGVDERRRFDHDWSTRYALRGSSQIHLRELPWS